MKSKHRFGWTVILGLSLSWLVSCNSMSSKSNQLEVEFWTMQLKPQFTEYFTELIENFEKEQNPLQVRWVDVPWEAMESKILTAVSAKTAPDVVNLNPNFASELATRNAWLDLESQIPESIQEQYLPKIWQAGVIEGQTFAIPWYLTTSITIYNQKLLAQANLQQPPQSYAELADTARQIKKKTGKYAFFATFVPGDSNEVLESLVQMGVQLLDEKGKAGFVSEEGKMAFQYWVDLYQQKLLPPEVLTQGHRYSIELYQAGETALLSTGAEFIKAIAQGSPDIAEVSAASGQITGKTGKKNVAVMNLVIPRDTNNSQEAVKFALFVTNTENQLAFAKSANVLPSTKAAVDKYIQELEQQQSLTSLQQARKISAMQLKDAEILVPPTKNLSKLQKIIYENLQAAMLGEKTVDEAVEDAAEEWDNLR